MCYYDASRSGLELWYKMFLTKAALQSLFVYVCVSIAGMNAEVENGWPYMKAAFKKHCPWSRIRSDHK